MNPILAGVLIGAGLFVARLAAVWALVHWPYPRPPARQPMRDLREVTAPTMIASEARKARGIQP